MDAKAYVRKDLHVKLLYKACSSMLYPEMVH